MSTPSRGSGNAKDPISLDSSDEDVSNHYQAGPSRSQSKPRRSISSVRRRSSANHSGGVVDLTVDDSGSDTTLPPTASQKPTSRSSQKSRLNQTRYGAELSSDQPIAGPSRRVKQEMIGQPGSWTNPTSLQPSSSSSQLAGSSSTRGTDAPVGSWGNPAPLLPPKPRVKTAFGINGEEGTWMNPTPLEPPQSLPPQSDFELPESWTAQNSAPTSPIPENPTLLPQPPTESLGSWSNPTPLVPPISDLAGVAQPPPAGAANLENMDNWIDSTLKLFTASQPDTAIDDGPVLFSSDPTRKPSSPRAPAIEAIGSWANPQPLEPPIPHVEPLEQQEPELGSWLNPAPLQPNMSYKRSPSPTELSKEDSAARKGKARRMESPERETSRQVEEAVEKVPEPVKPSAKKGPSWVTSEQPTIKKPQPVEKQKDPSPMKDNAIPPGKEQPIGIPEATIQADIVMEEAEHSAEIEQSSSSSAPLAISPTNIGPQQADMSAEDTAQTPALQSQQPTIPESSLLLLPEEVSDAQVQIASSQQVLTRTDTQTMSSITNDAIVAAIHSLPSAQTEISMLDSPVDATDQFILSVQDMAPVGPGIVAGDAVAQLDFSSSASEDAVLPLGQEAIESTMEVTEPKTSNNTDAEGTSLPLDLPPDGTPPPPSAEDKMDVETRPSPTVEGTGTSDPQDDELPVSSDSLAISPLPQAEIISTESGHPLASEVPHTPDISMPQTPSTSDSREVEAELTAISLSPIVESRVTANPAEQQIGSDSPRLIAETAENAVIYSTPRMDDSAGSAAAEQSDAASPSIQPLPSADFQPFPDPESSDELALQNSNIPIVDVKPTVSSSAQWQSTTGTGYSSLQPIEIGFDDDDLDCLDSDKEESTSKVDTPVDKAVETVRVGVDEVVICPLPQGSSTDLPRETRQSSSVPSIEEINSTDFIPRVSGSSSDVIVRRSEDIRTSRRAIPNVMSSPEMASLSIPQPEADSPTPKFEVVIPTRSRNAWRWIVEHGGESEIEDALDASSDAASSSGPSHAVEISHHNGFTVRKSYRLSNKLEKVSHSDNIDRHTGTQPHTILSEAIPDPLPPSERISRANRVLNTKLIDEWNRRKPSLTNNPSLHRAVFEAYMAQSTSIDEPQADEIRVVNDIDGEGAPPDFEFQYSNDMLYNPDVPDPELGIGCDCDGPCDPNNQNCSCVRRQELYFYDLGMKGFAYDEKGKIREASVSVWECGKTCGCPPECGNRVIQRGRGKDTKIELFKTKWKGWGVRARAPIAPGTFLGIYAGELITEQESEDRGRLYAQIGRTYLFDCDGWQIAHPPQGLARIDPRSAELAQLASERAKIAAKEADDPSYVYSAYSVDAFHYGFTRYFNHSCDPNLAITQAYIKDFHPERPILVIFARRAINRNEELCISYKGLPDDDEIPIPVPQPKLTTRNAKQKKSKTSASAHITGTAKGKMADKDRCMCKTARCDGRMFNYGG